MRPSSYDTTIDILLVLYNFFLLGFNLIFIFVNKLNSHSTLFYGLNFYQHYPFVHIFFVCLYIHEWLNFPRDGISFSPWILFFLVCLKFFLFLYKLDILQAFFVCLLMNFFFHDLYHKNFIFFCVPFYGTKYFFFIIS